MLTRKNLNKIKGQFSSLLLKVQSALKFRQVSVDSVRNFLVHYFRRSDWIHDPSNLDDLFTALSVAKLWNYDHYGDLEVVIEHFLPDDSKVKKFVSDYKSQLTGFYTTTRIADFIKLTDFEESEQDPEKPLPTDSFTLKDYRKLKLKLKIDRKVSAVTLSYVDELWRSLAEEFDLPSLTAVIHSIIEGSLVVTWLVLPHIAEKIIANSSKATKFFHRLGIVELAIDECIIYDAELMVTFERELLIICKGFPHVEPNTASRISHLLGYGVDPNISDDDGYTPLFQASMYGLVDLMRIFLQYGADVNQYSYMGRLPLYIASENRTTAAVKLLLEYGADVNLPIKCGRGDTALIVACYNGYSDIARILLDHSATIDYKNRKGRSALFHACFNDQVETVKLLLEYGANADGSSLYIASRLGFAEIVKLLVDYGDQVNVTYELKIGIQTTALHTACFNGHSQIAKLLIESGAMINAQMEGGHTPLHLACTNRHSQVVNILLSAGAMPNIMQNDGFTSLMLAANQEDSADMVAALLMAKADPNMKYRENDRTALWYAASAGNVSVVEILLENGAIIDDRDETGLTPYDIASINSHPDVCYLLEQYGYQPHQSSLSGTSGSSSVLPSPPQQPRPQRRDEITSLETFRAILERGSQDDPSLKHQTSHMSEESEEEIL